MRRLATCVLSTVASAGAVLALAAPAQAESAADVFLNALDAAGVTAPNTMNAVDTLALGQSVCPMLSQPGQNAADAAATVADRAGMSLGPATMFTGVAISMFCPAAVAGIGDGKIFGFDPFGL
ncbi:DUF732 domain-containing protein [Mycolicibacterium bacteremicum]|uniref:DUF732 domain-containing protein n=1 Tax=Mycolicibacterium bacteremicum TaxID=564198 RepID=UPI0026EBB25A|nr:DUF732 domain-containing protein [Mycolicibacterium bacteremicum]